MLSFLNYTKSWAPSLAQHRTECGVLVYICNPAQGSRGKRIRKNRSSRSLKPRKQVPGQPRMQEIVSEGKKERGVRREKKRERKCRRSHHELESSRKYGPEGKGNFSQDIICERRIKKRKKDGFSREI